MELSERFGDPREIVKNMLDSMDSDELVIHMSVKRRILFIVSIAAITIIVIWLGVVAAAYVDGLNQSRGYMEISVDICQSDNVEMGE